MKSDGSTDGVGNARILPGADEFWQGVWWRPDGGEQLRNATIKECATEIQRLRGRLAKIEHAPVPEDNAMAMTLKRWAASRDGEPITPAPEPTPKNWHPRVELRWRTAPGTSTQMPILEQLWQCEQTGELWWRPVPLVAGWEQGEP